MCQPSLHLHLPDKDIHISTIQHIGGPPSFRLRVGVGRSPMSEHGAKQHLRTTSLGPFPSCQLYYMVSWRLHKIILPKKCCWVDLPERSNHLAALPLASWISYTPPYRIEAHRDSNCQPWFMTNISTIHLHELFINLTPNSSKVSRNKHDWYQ